MIDLHTHTLLSDGLLLPSELVRRAEVKGYKAIAITDHVDSSNIETVVGQILKVCRDLNHFSRLKVIPGLELTHIPLNQFEPLVEYARAQGIKLILAHGETLVEPVIPGTNKKALSCHIDILSHPGLITLSEAKLAAKKGICLELTSRKGHSLTNGHVASVALEAKAKLVINTDSHGPEDLITKEEALKVGLGAGLSLTQVKQAFGNSARIVQKLMTNDKAQNPK
jgi:histidinol phosphatase-like PHP family hydrolase